MDNVSSNAKFCLWQRNPLIFDRTQTVYKSRVERWRLRWLRNFKGFSIEEISEMYPMIPIANIEQA